MMASSMKFHQLFHFPMLNNYWSTNLGRTTTYTYKLVYIFVFITNKYITPFVFIATQTKLDLELNKEVQRNFEDNITEMKSSLEIKEAKIEELKY